MFPQGCRTYAATHSTARARRARQLSDAFGPFRVTTTGYGSEPFLNVPREKRQDGRRAQFRAIVHGVFTAQNRHLVGWVEASDEARSIALLTSQPLRIMPVTTVGVAGDVSRVR